VVTDIHRLDATLTAARDAIRAKGADDLHFLHLYFRGESEWLRIDSEQHGVTVEVQAMIQAFEALDSALCEPMQTTLQI